MRTVYKCDDIKSGEVCVFAQPVCRLDKSRIFKAIDCYEASPIYEEIEECYEALKEEVLSCVTPRVVFKVEDSPETESMVSELETYESLIYSTNSLGEGISALIRDKYEDDEYLEAMLIDAMATNILFNINDQFYTLIHAYAVQENKGIKVFSPGERDFPIAYQKTIETHIGAYNDVRVTDGYALEPIKSGSVVYGLKEGIERPKRAHDCKKCPDQTCKWRRVAYEG